MGRRVRRATSVRFSSQTLSVRSLRFKFKTRQAVQVLRCVSSRSSRRSGEEGRRREEEGKGSHHLSPPQTLYRYGIT